jgi:hypothetical protein
MVSSSPPILPPGGLAYPGRGPANATTRRTESGMPPAGVRVLRLGVDLMALAARQGLDDTRRYRRMMARAVQISANGRECA